MYVTVCRYWTNGRQIEKEQAHNARIIGNLYNWNWAWIYGEIIFIHHRIILDVYTNFEHLFEATKWSSIIGFQHRYELRIFYKSIYQYNTPDLQRIKIGLNGRLGNRHHL